MSVKIYRATKRYESRLQETEYAFDLETAQARIRNYVTLSEPAEWDFCGSSFNSAWELSNCPSDCEVKVSQVRVGGKPDFQDLLEMILRYDKADFIENFEYPDQAAKVYGFLDGESEFREDGGQ